MLHAINDANGEARTIAGACRDLATRAASARLRALAPAAELSARTIVVVDDDSDGREVLKDVLEGSGFLVRAFGSGPEALDDLRSPGPPPGLILLDMNMPIMSGGEILGALKADPELATIPVVILSGARHGAAECDGAAGQVQKPIRIGDLLATVDRCRRR